MLLIARTCEYLREVALLQGASWGLAGIIFFEQFEYQRVQYRCCPPLTNPPRQRRTVDLDNNRAIR